MGGGTEEEASDRKNASKCWRPGPSEAAEVLGRKWSVRPEWMWPEPASGLDLTSSPGCLSASVSKSGSSERWAAGHEAHRVPALGS